MRLLKLAVCAAMACFCLNLQALAAEQRRAGNFDFYVLSLSWSPAFCAEEGDAEDSQQCRADRSYGFIVHGLWPQYERGYPRECHTSQRRVPDWLVRSLQDIMPSGGLVGHQWRMHGACSGLSQSDYFRQVRSAWQKVEIPKQFQSVGATKAVAAEDVEQAFVKANPGMSEDGISLSCGKRLLREVRICMTRDLQFRACGELERKACRADRLLMPPVRGN